MYASCKDNNLHQQINLSSAQHLPLQLPAHRSTLTFFQKIMQYCKVACMEQPLMYFTDGEWIDELLSWLQQVTHHKLFELAHKINDRDQPNQNILWFHSQSFHSWQAWLANELQKTIITKYFLKNVQNTQLNDFKKYLRSKKLTSLLKHLQFPINTCKVSNLIQCQNQIRDQQKSFYEYCSNQIINDLQKIQKKKKNAKKMKKKQNKNVQIQNQQETSQAQQEPEETKQEETNNKDINNKDINDGDIRNGDVHTEHSEYSSCMNLQNISNVSPISYKSDKPANLAPECPHSDERCLSEFYEHGQQCNYTIISTTLNEEVELEYPQQSTQTFRPNQPKSRNKRRNHKKQPNPLYQELSNKLTTTLINHQFSNFIDNLNIQTNYLYEDKIISFQRIRYFVQRIFPQTQAILFGSNAVGLSLPTSDIDIMLTNSLCKNRQEANQFLAQIAIEINAMGWIVSCSSYLNAKVPIIKLQVDTSISYLHMKRKSDYLGFFDPSLLNYLDHKCGENGKNIKIDLTFSLEGTTNIGSQATELMRNWIKQQPKIQRIIIAFKYILAQKGYNQNFKGGIGSYCLFVMIAAYYKQYKQELKSQEGENFLQILRFYGQIFENQLKSITIEPNTPSFISIEKTYSKSNFNSEIIYKNLLRIIDPINNRLMSSSCNQYNTIKSQFRRIYSDVKQTQNIINKELIMGYTVNQVKKILSNKKMIDKWVNKYVHRSNFNLKSIIDGQSV